MLNGRYSFGALPAGSTPNAFAVPVSNDGAGGAPRPGGDGAAVSGRSTSCTIAHETGHALGMRDELVSHDPVMYLYTLPGDASRRAPTNDDLDGLKEIYAEASSSSGPGCSSSTMSPKRPRVSPLVVGALLVVAAFGAFAARRRIPARGPLALAGALAVVAFPLRRTPRLRRAKRQLVWSLRRRRDRRAVAHRKGDLVGYLMPCRRMSALGHRDPLGRSARSRGPAGRRVRAAPRGR